VKELEHPALLHSTLEEFLAFMVPFVEGGLERKEPVVVAVGAERLESLRAEIAPRRTGIRWLDTRTWHPDPAPRLRAFHELVTDELDRGARRLRLVGEPVWPLGPPEFILEWERYESSLNEVLGPFPVTLVCTYDTSRLDPSIAASAWATHPTVRAGTSGGTSDRFVDPAEFLRSNAALPPVPSRASWIPGPVHLVAARGFLAREALAAGLSADRVADLCTAANEAVANASAYGGGVSAIRAWGEVGRFVCQIEDAGPGISDPFAGYRPPARTATGGRGLWLARQLVDLLQIAPGLPGTTIRLHMTRPHTG
jgi:anti-sigma regulatory factor (Ser/Thr protein kinase)